LPRTHGLRVTFSLLTLPVTHLPVATLDTHTTHLHLHLRFFSLHGRLPSHTAHAAFTVHADVCHGSPFAASFLSVYVYTPSPLTRFSHHGLHHFSHLSLPLDGLHNQRAAALRTHLMGPGSRGTPAACHAVRTHSIHRFLLARFTDAALSHAHAHTVPTRSFACVCHAGRSRCAFSARHSPGLVYWFWTATAHHCRVHLVLRSFKVRLHSPHLSYLHFTLHTHILQYPSCCTPFCGLIHAVLAHLCGRTLRPFTLVRMPFGTTGWFMHIHRAAPGLFRHGLHHDTASHTNTHFTHATFCHTVTRLFLSSPGLPRSAFTTHTTTFHTVSHHTTCCLCTYISFAGLHVSVRIFHGSSHTVCHLFALLRRFARTRGYHVSPRTLAFSDLHTTDFLYIYAHRLPLVLHWFTFFSSSHSCRFTTFTWFSHKLTVPHTAVSAHLHTLVYCAWLPHTPP